MDQHALYPVCPHRNVPAAFERFHGPDSGGIERFFGDERTHLRDASAAAHALLVFIWAATRLYNARLVRVWNHWAAHPQLQLLPGPRPIQALRVLFIPRAAPFVHLYGVLARVRSHWAANPQLTLLLGPQPIPAFPV
jgi:hypothetical protein